MRLLGGFGIGRWLGFPVRIDYSWFFIFLLVVWTFSEQIFPGRIPGLGTPAYYVMGVVFALLLFLSVLLHELSHSVVAEKRGIEVEGITLFIFGGVAQTRMEARTPKDEFLLTAAGPLMSVALGGLFWGLSSAIRSAGLWPTAYVVSSHLGWLNVGLAVFNMIPGFPLDGGRIFRSIVWYVTGDARRATRWASWGGRAFGYLLIGGGAWLFLQGATMDGLWSAFIGWFLASAASSAYRQFEARRLLADVPVERVMSAELAVVPEDAPVETLVDDFFLRRPHRVYPVVRDGALTGVVSLEDVASVDPARRSTTPVRDVMREAGTLPTVTPGETVDTVLNLLATSEDDRVLVARDGRLLGTVSSEQIGNWLDRARALGVDEGEGGASGAPPSGTPPSGSSPSGAPRTDGPREGTPGRGSAGSSPESRPTRARGLESGGR